MSPVILLGGTGRKESSTMAHKVTDACIGCGACEGACPVGAVKVEDGVAVVTPALASTAALARALAPPARSSLSKRFSPDSRPKRRARQGPPFLLAGIKEQGAALQQLPIGRHLAGVASSCISQVSLVSTSGVWSLRNLPPQTPALSYVYYTKFIPACKGSAGCAGTASSVSG